MKIDHIGIAVKDLETAIKAYKGLNLEVTSTDTVAGEGVKVAFLPVGEIRIELLQAINPDSIMVKFIEKRGEGVHHIAFEVKDMDDRIAEMRDRGINLIQQGRWTTYSGGRYAYFNSNDRLAVMLELLENF